MWRLNNLEMKDKLTGGFLYQETFTQLMNYFPDLKEKYLIAEGFQKPAAEDLGHNHKFKEIDTQSDFYEICVSKKACAIALLPAIDEIDWEKEAHE